MPSNSAMVECGFCQRKNDALREPKALPCTHVHCLGCLTDYYDANKYIECPFPECR